MVNYKKIFLILFLSFVLFSFGSNFCFAQRALEIDYPAIPDFVRPTTVRALLPEYIQYLFALALMVAGLIVFGSLIYGGIRYLTSTGSPSAISDAKSRIFAAILGLVILLCSYLLLKTINPELVMLKAEKEPITKGIIIFKGKFCQGAAEPISCENNDDCVQAGYTTSCGIGCGGQGSGQEPTYPDSRYNKLAKDNKALKIRTSLSNLEDFLKTDEAINAIFFLESPEDLRVFLYEETNWGEGGRIRELITTHAGFCGEPSDTPWPDPLGPNGWRPGSIRLFPQVPGIYLCNQTYSGSDNDICGTEDIPGKELFLDSDINLVPADFNDKTKGLRILNKSGLKKGVVLHSAANRLQKGELFLDNEPNLDTARSGSYKTGEIRGGVSSATVFTLDETGTGEVIFYEAINHTGNSYICNPATRECCNDSNCYSSVPQCGPVGDEIPFSMCVSDVNIAGIPADKISSIAFGNSNYMAILFDDTGFREGCQVFTEDDKDFTDDQIGRCGCIFGDFGCGDCLASFILLPVGGGGAGGGGKPPPPACTDECLAEDEEMCTLDENCTEEAVYPPGGVWCCVCSDHDGDGCLEWVADRTCASCKLEGNRCQCR